MRRIVAGTCIATVIAGCGGGGEGGDPVNPSGNSAQTIEEVIYARNARTIPSQSKTYSGDYSAIDTDATAADNGFAVTEVTRVFGDTDPDNGDELAGHQVIFNDGTVLEFGCVSSSISFPDGGKLTGTFLIKKTYGSGSKDSKVSVTITDKENALNYNLGEYGGIGRGDFGNPEFKELGRFEIITYGDQAPIFEVGRTLVAPLTDIKVHRIVQFASYSLGEDRLIPFSCSRERVLEQREPLPAFDSVGPSWTFVSPYDCWLRENGQSSNGTSVNCPIWKAEKGW